MGENDDFLVPSNTDIDDPCAVNIERGAALTVVLPLFASLSMVCYFYLLWMYFFIKSPVFMRHPTTLAVYKCMFEILLVQQYLWAPSLRTQSFYDDDHIHSPYSCHSSGGTAYMAFITQIALVGSELCFVVISLDLRSAYTNPFSSYKQNRVYYAAFVMGLSVATGLALLFMGPKVYGLSNLGLVWIQNRRSDHSPPYPKFVLYYIFVMLAFGYSLWANFLYTRDSERGLSKAVSNRLTIMKRSRDFTFMLLAYSFLLFLIEIITFLMHEEDVGTTGWIPPFLQSFRGVWGLATILYSNRQDLSWEVLDPFRLSLNDAIVENVAVERLMLEPHLNTTLRSEILYFTTQGIMFAAREYQEIDRIRSLSRDHLSDLSLRLQQEAIANAAAKEVDAADTASAGAVTGEDMNDNDRQYSFDEGGAVRPSMLEETGVGIFGRSSMRMSNSAKHVSTLSEEAMRAAHEDTSRQMRSRMESVNREQDLAVARMLRAAVEDEIHEIGCYHKRVRPYNAGYSEIPWAKNNKSTTAAASVGGAAAGARDTTSSEPTNISRDPTIVAGTGTARGYTRNPLIYRSRSSAAARDSQDSGFEMQTSYGSSHRPGSAINRVSVGRSIQVHSTIKESTPSQERSTNNSENAESAISQLQQLQLPNVKEVRDSENLEFGIHVEDDELERGHAPRWRRISKKASLKSLDPSTDQITGTFRTLMANASSAAKTIISAVHRDFRFKDFCPKLFARMRELCGLDSEHYARSFERTCKEKFSEGRSGAFMFYSSTQQFIVKTTTKQESCALHRVLPQFVRFVENNPNSLVVRFLGSHRITMYGVRLYFVVMLNVFPTFALSERYDLKGSWVNRHGFSGSRRTRKERMNLEEKNFAPLYQDNDLQHKISLETDVACALASQIRRDIIFLRDLNIMDYSLLIGVGREKFKVLNADDVSSLNRLTATTLDAAATGERVVLSSASFTNLTDPSAATTSAVVNEQRSTTASENRVSFASNIDDTNIDAAAAEDSTSTKQRTSAMKSAKERKSGNSNYWRMNSTAGGPDSFGRDAAGGMKALFVEGPGTYYIGIIDVLQEWNWNKYFERQLKIYGKFVDSEGLSAVSPFPYAERFWRRCVLDTFEGLEDDEGTLSQWRMNDDEDLGDFGASSIDNTLSMGNSSATSAAMSQSKLSEAERATDLESNRKSAPL